MHRLKEKFYDRRSEYFKNSVTLFSGTAVSQLLLIAITPVLSRLYPPAAFGNMTLAFSIISVLSIVGTGRYELAILLPKNSEWAKHLVRLVFIVSTIFCLSLYLPLLFAHSFLESALNLAPLGYILYLLPLFIWVNANGASTMYWLTREKDYNKISFNKLFESGVSIVLNVVWGIFAYPKGLLLGRGIGRIASLLLYLKQISKKNFRFWNYSKRKTSFVATRYNKFPRFLVIAHFFNTAANELPSIIINKAFGNVVLGFYGFANRLTSAPLAIVAVSLGSVFREQAAKDFATNGECKRIYITTLKALIKLSVVPFLIFALFSPQIFSFAFGKQWYVAGEYARYLIPMNFLQFICNPLSSLFVIAEKQQQDLIWQLCLFAINVATLIIGGYFLSVKWTLITFSICYSIMYFINILMSYNFAKGSIKKH